MVGDGQGVESEPRGPVDEVAAGISDPVLGIVPAVGVQVDFQHRSLRRTVAPIAAGLSMTMTPACRSAAALAAAPPCPPSIRAPAWPMRLPSGAVRPAM